VRERERSKKKKKKERAKATSAKIDKIASSARWCTGITGK